MLPPRRSTAEAPAAPAPTGLLRLAGAALFVGALLMLFEGLREQQPLFLLSGLLQGAGWWCFVSRANRLERLAR